ncbi:hypothetical protein KKA14_07420, partial [bacterium]|nr:hypothetical protein [bacterium]
MSAGKEVNNFLSTITEIAHQTNVLSINARIEASKAGEQGKGFAVVSERIRLLAERTTVAAEQIQNTIQQSNKRIIEGQEAVKTVDEHFTHINEKMEENNKIVDLIHKSNSGQNLSLKEIELTLKNLEESGIEIAAVADQINKNTNTQLGISTTVSNQTEDLLSRIKQFKY